MGRCPFFCGVLISIFWIGGGRAQYTLCDGNTSWIADGFCDQINNNFVCGYDGGDCCECTCSQGPKYHCGVFGSDCLDPSTSNVTSECLNTASAVSACSTEYSAHHWIVNDMTLARSLADAVNCTGGTFNVTWKGRIVIDRTIEVAEGTTVYLTGVDSGSEVDGGGSIRILLWSTPACMHIVLS